MQYTTAVHVYLFGMKYPASRMIGGSMKRKNRFGVNVEGGCSDVRNRRKPEGNVVLGQSDVSAYSLH